VRPLGARHVWLSITPEPESELPRAIATLRSGGPPPPALVRRETARAEALVLRGSRRAWRRYLAEARSLADSAGEPALRDARALVEDVVHNHDNLELAL
jgi:hypothetical protein